MMVKSLSRVFHPIGPLLHNPFRLGSVKSSRCPFLFTHAPSARERAATRLFVKHGLARHVHSATVCVPGGRPAQISACPPAQLSIDNVCGSAKKPSAGDRRCHSVGLPESKDETASGAYADDGIVQRALRAIKRQAPGLLLLTDVCNCEYTSHGHCGKSWTGTWTTIRLSSGSPKPQFHARAGADIVAPSDHDGAVWLPSQGA